MYWLMARWLTICLVEVSPQDQRYDLGLGAGDAVAVQEQRRDLAWAGLSGVVTPAVPNRTSKSRTSKNRTSKNVEDR